MKHPLELLPDYALGVLSDSELVRIEAHLETCASCRAEVRRTGESLVMLVETLPQAEPPAGAWEGIRARLTGAGEDGAEPEPAARRARPPAWRSWNGWAMAAALVVALSGGFWGYSELRQSQQLRAEQQQVARWMAQPQVRMEPLADRSGAKLGGLLLLPDGRALFVLQHPPEAGKAYQAWGHKDDEVVSLGVSKRPVFEVRYQDYQALYLSLEPEAGSPKPTHGLSAVTL